MEATKPSQAEHAFELVRNTSVQPDVAKPDIENARLTEGLETSAAVPHSPWQASQREATETLA